MNKGKLHDAIKQFAVKKKTMPVHFAEDWQDRQGRRAYYSAFNSREKIMAMTEEELVDYISNLWAMMMWGDKQGHAKK